MNRSYKLVKILFILVHTSYIMAAKQVSMQWKVIVPVVQRYILYWLIVFLKFKYQPHHNITGHIYFQ